jgi:hypothetical protein
MRLSVAFVTFILVVFTNAAASPGTCHGKATFALTAT